MGVKERTTGKVYAIVASHNDKEKQASSRQLFAVLKKGLQGKQYRNDRPVFRVQYSWHRK